MVFNQDVFFVIRDFPFPCKLITTKLLRVSFSFFLIKEEGNLTLRGLGIRPTDHWTLRARSSHHVKPTSAHINQAYFSPYYLLWASTDADRIVLFLSDHVCTSRSIRFIAGAKMTPSRHFWCPVCVDLCFLNTARTRFAFDVNDNIDRLWKLKRCLSK